jgi:hypothetical protein
MGTKSKREIHLCFIYSLCVYIYIYMFYLRYKNKQRLIYLRVSTSVEHCVHVGAQKVSDFGGFRNLEFRIRDIQPVSQFFFFFANLRVMGFMHRATELLSQRPCFKMK